MNDNNWVADIAGMLGRLVGRIIRYTIFYFAIMVGKKCGLPIPNFSWFDVVMVCFAVRLFFSPFLRDKR